MSTSGSWDQAGDQGADLQGRLGRLNVGAQPFVPNVNACSFVPRTHHPQQYGMPLQHGYMGSGHGPPGYGHYYPQQHHGSYQRPPPGAPPPRHQHPLPPAGPTAAIPVSRLEAAHALQEQQQEQQEKRDVPTASPSSSALPKEEGKSQQHHLDTSSSSDPLLTTATTDDSNNKQQGLPLPPPQSDGASSASSTKDSDVLDTWEEFAKEEEEEGTAVTDTKTATKPPPSNNSDAVSSLEKQPAAEKPSKQPSPQLLSEKPKQPLAPASEPMEAKPVSKIPVLKKQEGDKESVNIVFIGHVDAGKSTIGGHVMYLTGQVDKRTLEKYEREAKEKNRETWYLSWALDTNQEERDKGKTVEVGRASFETEKKLFTILDAPGHAGFVPNMISGAAQADVGVLVISARRGEFETGFERRGQTREHAMLAKTAGVRHLVVLINKMDDSTVNWSEERYEECKTKLTPFLKKVGFSPKTDIFYIPVSGLVGSNLKELAPKSVCPWYKGPPFVTYIDELPPLNREEKGPFRLPIIQRYKEMGTVVMGKVESGAVAKGSSLLLMPNRTPVEVLSLARVEDEIPTAFTGDNIKLKLKGVEAEDISPGFVLCDPTSPCHVASMFDAQIVIREYKSIICAGYRAVLHIHAVAEEVQIVKLKALIDKKTGKVSVKHPRFIKQDQVAIASLQATGIICLETFKEFPQMARFTLRDEGKTVAIGKVLKLLE